MKSRIIKILLVCSIICLFAGCGKKEKIANYTIDAEYAISHGNYSDARAAYNNILSLDKENRVAIYGLKDLEESARQKDSAICSRIHTELCSALFDSEIQRNLGYIAPIPGDYELDAFVKQSGTAFKDAVYKNSLQISSAYDLSKEFVSLKSDGLPLAGSDIRVALYSISNNYIEMCVYIPDSKDSLSDEMIRAGAKYISNFNFADVTPDCTVYGVHSHTYLVGTNGEKVDKVKQGDVLFLGDFPKHPSKKPTTPVNPAKQYEVMSKVPDGILNAGGLSGLVLKDENGNYYFLCGRVSSSIEELMCISESEALDSLDLSSVDRMKISMVDKNF